MNLSELETDKIQQLINDPILMSVLLKIFLGASEASRPEVNKVDDNALLGEKYRSWELSKEIINNAFVMLQSYQIEKIDKKHFNRAR